MKKINENLMWALMEGLDKVLECSSSNEEHLMYHSLVEQIESIYEVKISTLKYGLSGEVVKHVPIISEIGFNEIFDYLGYES